MRIKFTDEEYEFNSYEFCKEDNKFLIYDRERKNTIEYIPKLELQEDYQISNFEIYFMFNEREECTENSIYPVHVKEQRIGWIFPMQALLSTEHNFVKNSYFLKYAYVATCLLLDKINNINQVDFIPSIELEDYYKDSIILLVLDKTNCSQIQGFNLDDYVVSLYKQGYSFSGRGNLSSIIEKPNKRLNIVSCSSELVQVRFISNLFKKSIPVEREEFAKFYTYYQIVEILISVVFDCKFKKFVNDLYLNEENLFEKKDELSEMTSEKRRVSWLFANHVKIQRRDVDVLNELCKKILRRYQKNVSDVCSDNLYAIRCLLVHRMYMLDEESYETLNELNVVFLDILMEMILTFYIAEA